MLKKISITDKQFQEILRNLTDDEAQEVIDFLTKRPDLNRNKRLNDSITELGLSARSFNSFRATNLETVKDVLENKRRLHSLRGLGNKGVKEVEDALARYLK